MSVATSPNERKPSLAERIRRVTQIVAEQRLEFEMIGAELRSAEQRLVYLTTRQANYAARKRKKP